MAFGVDYKLNKAFTTQLYYIGYKDSDRTVSLATGGTGTTPKLISDPKSTAIGLGVIYNF